MKTTRLCVFVLGTILSASATANAAVFSQFITNNDGWDGVGFADTGVPNFSSPPIVNAVVYNAAGGNPGGFVTLTDMDGTWLYFRAPAAFLGDKSSSISGAITFNIIRLDNFNTAFHDPQAPLVAVTNGTLVLVNTSSFSLPTGSWQNYSIPLSVGTWKVGTASGATANASQLNSVFSNLTGFYILADFLLAAGANGEIIGLDNVNIPTGLGGVPEPASVCLVGLGLAALWWKSRSAKTSD